ncbi:MAG: hypothetical protein ACK49D_11865 [Flavobacteriia bacterium]|jgi:hypothetical protein|nr:hypothetical protein [Cryomorphaceae bacterium]
MKKFIFLIGLLALLISSCGTHKGLHFMGANLNQQIVQTSNVVDKSEEVIASDELRLNNRTTIQTQTTDAEIESISKEKAAYPDTTDTAEEPEMSSEEASEAVQQAMRSEKIAKTAKNLGIAGIVTMWLSFLSIVALPLMIASLICYLKANKARYNTEQGVKSLKTAKKLLIFYGIVVAAAILLTIVLILLLI